MILINTKEELENLTSRLRGESIVSLDFETTGLNAYKGDKPFILSLATVSEEFVVPVYYPRLVASLLKVVLGVGIETVKEVRGFNIKFDLHFCNTFFGIKPGDINSTLVDAQVLARLVKNDALKLSLDEVSKWYSLRKDKQVEEFIKDNKCYRLDQEGERIPDYAMVPPEIMHKYAAQDARLHYDLVDHLLMDLGKHQKYLQTLSGEKDIFKLAYLESSVTKVLLGMEAEGVLLDEAYTKAASSFETGRIVESEQQYRSLTGEDLTDSAKALERVFGQYPDILRDVPTTEKGNRSFTDEVLSGIEHPIASAVRGYREANKKVSTYYKNFESLRGFDGRIHTNFRQPGTQTGRLSASNPNLQNVPKEDASEYKARACFIAPPGYKLLSIDYQAQEFRLLLDHSEEMGVIKAVLSGIDVHQATADAFGVSRKVAKLINFGLLYGMGILKLANTLGVSKFEANNLKEKYFRELPKIASFTQAITKKAESGKVSNWAGRVFIFSREYSHKAVNYVIQGGCSDIMRVALVGLHDFLKKGNYKTRVILSIHDEVCFYLKEGEEHIIPELQRIMTEAYPSVYLPLTTEASIGTRWGELEKYRG